MKTTFISLRLTILCIAIMFAFHSCSKVYSTQNSAKINNETGTNQKQQTSSSNQSLSGITYREIISNSAPFYADNDTAEATQHPNKSSNDVYPLIQPISPIFSVDTLPIATTNIPIISKENNAALLLGIIGLILPIFAIILAPIGLKKAALAKRQILENPETYTGRNQLKLAVALNIISLIFFILLAVYLTFLILFLFQIFSAI